MADGGLQYAWYAGRSWGVRLSSACGNRRDRTTLPDGVCIILFEMTLGIREHRLRH